VASYYTEGTILADTQGHVSHPKVAILSRMTMRDGNIRRSEGRPWRKRQSTYVAEATYRSRLIPPWTRQVIALKASGANVFFNGGTPKFVAQAIRKASRCSTEAG